MHFLGVFLLASVALLSGCKKSQTQPEAPEGSLRSAEVIRIGEVGSMTGSDATFGQSTHQGVLLAVKEMNDSGGIHGKKIELISLDDEGKPSEAVLAITKLINQHHVKAVIGEVASTRSLAMAPIAQQFKVPMITPSSLNSKVTQVGDYIFRVCFLDRFQSEVMARFALENLHAKRAAILTDNKSDYSRDSAELFASFFKKGGGQIVIEQTYSAGDIDFRAQLTAIRGTQPDVLLVPGYYTDIGLIALQKKGLTISAPMLGGDAWDSPKLKEIGGAALDGSYFVSHFAQNDPSPQIQKFVKDYQSAYRMGPPDGLAALGYDSALVLADALKRAKSESTQDLRDALEQTRDFVGVTGKISIDKNRNAVKPAVVFELVNGGQNKISTRISAQDFSQTQSKPQSKPQSKQDK